MTVSSKNVSQTRLLPTLRHKADFAYESSAPSAARADSDAEYKTRIYYRVSDCFVGCSARALSLIGLPFLRSVGTTHATIGLFRTPKWATHRVEAGQPMAWQPCLCPGLQRGVDTPVRTRALTGGAVCAWMALPPGVWRQRWWHASRSRQRGAARPRARP